MSSKLVLGSLVAVAVLAVSAFLVVSPGASQKVTVYKSPTCGCCAKWVDYLKGAGYSVEVEDHRDMTPIKMQHGVKREYSSCHTAVVDGYVLEGHVPVEYIAKLLEEKPQGVKGIAVPGMPIGSPGMEGPNPQTYDVVAFDENGKTKVYGTVEAGS